MEIREYQDNGMNIREIWVDGVLKGKEVSPMPTELPQETQETLEQKVDRIELQRQDDTLMQLDVLATIYEELLMKGSV
jgi:hypothetical protein